MKTIDITLVSIDSVYGQPSVNSLYWCIKNMEQIGIKFAEVKYITSIDNYLKLFVKKELAKEGINVVGIEKIKNIFEYSRFCIKDLNKYFNTKHVLVCQYDGFIIKPELWTEEFLEYDYIGACWPNQTVGNGGFSLRSKKICDILAAKDIRQCHPEDAVIHGFKSTFERDFGIKFAPAHVAQKFSYEYKRENSFGFHQRYDLKNNTLKMIEKFGELKISDKIKFI